MNDKIIFKPLRGQEGFVEPLTFTQQTVQDIKELKERITALETEIKILKSKKG